LISSAYDFAFFLLTSQYQEEITGHLIDCSSGKKKTGRITHDKSLYGKRLE